MTAKKVILFLFLLSIALIIYSRICQSIPLYFFWESWDVGFYFLLVSIFSALVLTIKTRRKKKANTVVFIFLSIMTVLFVLLYAMVSIGMGNSDAAKACKEYALHDKALAENFGHIKGFGFSAAGKLSEIHIGEEQASGEGHLTLLIKGDKKYGYLSFDVKKEPSKPWEVLTLR